MLPPRVAVALPAVSGVIVLPVIVKTTASMAVVVEQDNTSA